MFRRIETKCAAGLALALATAGCATTPYVNDGPEDFAVYPAMPAPIPPAGSAASPPYYTLPPQERAAWLSECHRRLYPHMYRDSWHLSRKRGERQHAVVEQRCSTYLDSYYAYYGESYARYAEQVAATNAARPPVKACCETVTYEEVPERPARRTIPARKKPVPDKRVKAAPAN